MSKFKIYAKSILLPIIAGGIIGLIIPGFMDYDSLNKPPLSPPQILFPIVWGVLYILMVISYGILKSKSLTDKTIDFVYYIQLAVNLLWPIAFFVLKWRLLALVIIIILDVFVFVMGLLFYSKDKLAGILQIPYFLWIIFATYLNLMIFILNL